MGFERTHSMEVFGVHRTGLHIALVPHIPKRKVHRGQMEYLYVGIICVELILWTIRVLPKYLDFLH
jgi:hypothetical protein